MKFSKEKFKKNATKDILKKINIEHRNALDGKKINDGVIYYTIGEVDYYLYPVEKDWCQQ